MYQLPKLPDAVRSLRADESARLDAEHPNLPKNLDRDCITCMGKKTFKWWDNYGQPDAQIVEYECPCSDQFLLYKYFLNAGLGKQATRAFLADAQDVDARAMMKSMDYADKSDYYVSRGMGLVFYGSHGNGKTLTSVLLTKDLLSRGIDGYFTTFSNMLDNFASGWRDEPNRVWFNKKVRNSPLLVVDDIGRENKNMNNMASSALDGVFRNRVQNALPTIVTTNLSLPAFEKAYSSGVMSLLTETSFTYEFTGVDWRPKQKKRNELEIEQMLVRPVTVR